MAPKRTVAATPGFSKLSAEMRNAAYTEVMRSEELQITEDGSFAIPPFAATNSQIRDEFTQFYRAHAAEYARTIVVRSTNFNNDHNMLEARNLGRPIDGSDRQIILRLFLNNEVLGHLAQINDLLRLTNAGTNPNFTFEISYDEDFDVRRFIVNTLFRAQLDLFRGPMYHRATPFFERIREALMHPRAAVRKAPLSSFLPGSTGPQLPVEDALLNTVTHRATRPRAAAKDSASSTISRRVTRSMTKRTREGEEGKAEDTNTG